ncbi:hypothetical protein TRICI_006614 [Trichomonascus ciferrii]|uniref:Uncharacterized protein n=1 Tax=Trichomonascus ciferrii TaxID=44093 RepID=A0A642UFY8_9ASCO|nr:hypothetical protein TRICI_006614 [Trichomonascus ciferrii]
MVDMASNASLIGEGGGQSTTFNGDNEIDPHLDGVWICFDFNDAKWTEQLRNFLSNSSSQDADILICIQGVTTDSIDLVDGRLDKLNIKGRRSFYPRNQTFCIKIVYEEHEEIRILLMDFLMDNLSLLGAHEKYLWSHGSARTTYDDGGAKEPDDSFLPYHAAISTFLGKRRDCRQISVEVALSETLQRLNADIRKWLVKTRLQTRTAVGVKVDQRRLRSVVTVWDFSSEGLCQLHDELVAGGANADDIEFLRRCLTVTISQDIQQMDWFLGFSSVTNQTNLRTFYQNNRDPMSDGREGLDDFPPPTFDPLNKSVGHGSNAFTELEEFQNATGAAPTNLGRHIINAADNDQPQTPETLSNTYEELLEAECERLLRLSEPDKVEITFRSGTPRYVGGVTNIPLRTGSLIGFEAGRKAGSSIVLDEPFLESLFEEGMFGGNIRGGVRLNLSEIGIAYIAYTSGIGQRVDTIPLNQAIDLVAQTKNVRPDYLLCTYVARHFIRPEFQGHYV